jgi:HK97 family phage portal protein
MAFRLSSIWNSLFGGRQSSNALYLRSTASRVTVTTDIALQTTAFLRAARVVAEGMGSMPRKLYEEGDENDRTVRKTARKHKSYKAICYLPCWLTKTEFVETLTMHAFVMGDGHAIINRGGGPTTDPVLELLPLLPGDVTFAVNKEWEAEYKVAFSGFSQTFKAGEILHIRGPSWDGRIGMSILDKAREAIGLSRALEQTHASLMGTDARPAGILTTQGAVSDEAANKIRERWRAAYGPGGTKGVAVLDNGYDFKSIQMNAVDAQYIENRRFQIEEIARATGVFPQMLMHVDKTATFASSSEFFAAHVKYTMLPWTNRWEEALKRDAIGWEGKNEDIWPRFTMDVLLRAAPKERGEFYSTMIDRGVLSPNEVRALENLNPREGGDEYLTPMNMQSGADDPAKEPPDGDPPPPPKDKDDDDAA